MGKGPVAIGGFRATREKLEEAAKVGRSMKPAFVRCRERALAQNPPTLNGHVRLLVRVFPSGGVRDIELPQWRPTDPIFDWLSEGSPMPNPDNGNLARLVVPCLKARVFQSHFSASQAPWAFTIDITFP
jgi:hypothetical protein